MAQKPQVKVQVVIDYEARNAAFMDNTKQRRAALIAQDVLKQLALGRYSATQMTYFRATEIDSPEDSLQLVLEQEGTHCQVCAVGGVFASCVRLANQYDLDSFEKCSSDVVRVDGFTRDGRMTSRLLIAFTYMELLAMEYCFEQRNPNPFASPLTTEMGQTIRESSIGSKCMQEADDSKRMELIMKHIIKNSGRFSVKGLTLAPNNPNKE